MPSRWDEHVCVLWQATKTSFMCCATFVVSRERVLGRPRELYEAVFQWLRDTVGACTVVCVWEGRGFCVMLLSRQLVCLLHVVETACAVQWCCGSSSECTCCCGEVVFIGWRRGWMWVVDCRRLHVRVLLRTRGCMLVVHRQ